MMKKTHQHREKIIGIAWYRKEQWGLLRQIYEEPDKLEDTYEEWLFNAVALKKKLELEGLSAKEVDIDMESIIIWCKERHIPINSKNIADYVALKLRASNKL